MTYLDDLNEFCSFSTDRKEYLKNWLSRENIQYNDLKIKEDHHLIITPGGLDLYQQEYKKKILIAHYDKDEGSPGANDNSAAVMQLLILAKTLQTSNKKHNILIILSDGEELQQQSLKEQGAYKLAEALKKYNLDKAFLLVIDMCGIGDTMVFSSSAQRKQNETPSNEIPSELKELILKHSRGQEITQLEYYSDDLGFMAMGFPTLLISLIPWYEKKYLEQKKMPPSWSTKHSILDSVDQLQGQSFRIMGSFLLKLSDLLLPLT